MNQTGILHSAQKCKRITYFSYEALFCQLTTVNNFPPTAGHGLLMTSICSSEQWRISRALCHMYKHSLQLLNKMEDDMLQFFVGIYVYGPGWTIWIQTTTQETTTTVSVGSLLSDVRSFLKTDNYSSPCWRRKNHLWNVRRLPPDYTHHLILWCFLRWSM